MELYELSQGWVWATINDIIDTDGLFVDGDWIESKDQNPDGEIRLIQLADIGDGNFKNKSNRYLTYQKALELNCTFLLEGDVLIARMPEPLGRSCIFPFKDKKRFITAVDVAIVRTRSNSISNKYLMYIINTPQTRLKIEQLQTGTTRKRISRSNLATIIIPLPPLPEQHRIVARIEELFTRLDAGVEALKKIKTQLKRYRQSVLKHAFEGELTKEWREVHKEELEPASVLLERIKEERKQHAKGKYKELSPWDTSDLPELPGGWVWTRVGEISERIHYGYTASSNTEPIGPKMLRITDIQNNSVNWDNVPYCQIDVEEKQKYLLKDGDLVFARTGATVGKSFLIRGKIPETIFASYLIRIILSDRVRKEFVYNFFQTHAYWLQIHKKQIGIGQPNVNSQTLSRIVLPLPPLPEQHKIVEEIERRFSVADEIGKTVDQSLKQSKRLRQSILKKAFEGKLVPQDPTDEPAELLLERIKAEKAKCEAEEKEKKMKNKKVNTKQTRLMYNGK